MTSQLFSWLFFRKPITAQAKPANLIANPNLLRVPVIDDNDA
jgi:hypothetical protein